MVSRSSRVIASNTPFLTDHRQCHRSCLFACLVAARGQFLLLDKTKATGRQPTKPAKGGCRIPRLLEAAACHPHPPSQDATVSGPRGNAGVLRPVRRSPDRLRHRRRRVNSSEVGSLGEGGLKLRRVTPYRRCHGLSPAGLHSISSCLKNTKRRRNPYLGD